MSSDKNNSKYNKDQNSNDQIDHDKSVNNKDNLIKNEAPKGIVEEKNKDSRGDEKLTAEEKHTTTGHKWDDISEYNIPTPRWWLTVWIICIIWAVIYWFFYPAWPTIKGNTKGSLSWSTVKDLRKTQDEINKRKADYINQISKMNFNEIIKNNDLVEFSLNAGESIFKKNCAACHGNGAQGSKGYPNLNDDDWLWGGKFEDIQYTLTYGIRSGHEKARFNQMPSFGKDKILTNDQIEAVINYVETLSIDTNNTQANNTEKVDANNIDNSAEKITPNVIDEPKLDKDKISEISNKEVLDGKKIFIENCSSCHGINAKGNKEMGAPNLTDAIWLYGNKREDIRTTIYYARNGVMPAWGDRLSESEIKILTIYVHSLGGGE